MREIKASVSSWQLFLQRGCGQGGPGFCGVAACFFGGVFKTI
jgi:hypothetical protein